MSGLAEFLLTRIAEDEARARQAADSEGSTVWRSTDRAFTHSVGIMPGARAHIASHDPARVLAECEAKRRIMEFADEATLIDDLCDMDRLIGPRTDPYIGDQILGALAAVYADHPDYDPEWRL